MLHRLRGLYDTYDVMNLPQDYPDPPPAVLELRAFMAEHAEQREALPEFFERVAALRDAPGVPRGPVRVPGPVHPRARPLPRRHRPRTGRRSGATARSRPRSASAPGYFPPGADVFVAHPPTGLEGLRGGRGRYLFTVSRLDVPKRIELLIAAMAQVSGRVELRIAGTGPDEARLRELAAGDPRITLLRAASAAPSWPTSTRAPARSPSSRSSRTSGSSRSRRCSRASR